MTILREQKFDDVPLTNAWEIKSGTISMVASDQSFNDTSGGGAFAACQVGDGFRDYGTGNSNASEGQNSDRSNWRITSKPNNNKIIVVNDEYPEITLLDYPSGTRWLVSGATSAQLQSALFPMGTGAPGNPSAYRVLSNGGSDRILENVFPARKVYSGSNGSNFRVQINNAIGNHSELYFSYWARYLPGLSVCTLNNTLTSGQTTSFAMTLQTGDMLDFALDRDMPNWGPPDPSYQGSNTQEFAETLVLGDWQTPGGHEIIGYITRTAGNNTTVNTISRGLFGTTAQSWPPGTQIRSAYKCRGQKVPELIAGSVSAGGVAGETYCRAGAGYIGTDYTVTPRPSMVATLYRYDGDFVAHQSVFGATSWGGDGTSRKYTPGKWHCIEMRVVMNSSSGAADGLVQCWFDGVLVINDPTARWRKAGSSIPDYWGWLSMTSHMASNGNDADGSQKYERRHFDRMIIADAPINAFSLGRGAAAQPSVYHLRCEEVTYTGDGVSGRVITLTDGRTPKFVIGSGSSQSPFYKTDLMTNTGQIANINSADFTNGVTFAAGQLILGTDERVNNTGTTYRVIVFYDDDFGELKTHQYTGTGVAQEVPLGGAYDFVFVKSAANQFGASKQIELGGPSSSSWDSGTALVSDGITGLTANGFNVGAGQYANSAGVVYNVFAFKNVPGYIQTGSYIGDDSDSRQLSVANTKPGATNFTPLATIITQTTSGRYTMGRWAVPQGTDLSMRMLNLSHTTDHIQNTTASGIEIGTNFSVNSSGITYLSLMIADNPTQTVPVPITTRSLRSGLSSGINSGVYEWK